MMEIDKYLFKLREGDEASFKAVYDYFFPKLYYFALDYVRHADIAENIVQDTMLTLWNKKNLLTDDTNISAYLFTVTKHNCMYRMRELRYKKQLYVDTDLDDIENQFNIEALELFDTSRIAINEIELIISRTLTELPEQCRKVFTLSRFEDKKNKEIADILQISIKTVEGHITKALKLFRNNLKSYLTVLILFLLNNIKL